MLSTITEFQNNFVPTKDLKYNIGSQEKRVKTLYAGEVFTEGIKNTTGNLVFENTDTTGKVQVKLGTTDINTDFEVVKSDGTQIFNVDASGAVSIPGSLTTGTHEENTTITDLLIELGNGRTGTPSGDSGIVIERGDENNAFIGFDESTDKFVMGTGAITGVSTGDLTISTGTLIANLEGTVNTATQNSITTMTGLTSVGSAGTSTTFSGGIESKNGATSSGFIDLYEDSDNGNNKIRIIAPAAVTTDITLTLPDSDGDVDQVLTTDGNGTLSWTTVSGSSSLNDLSDVLVENSSNFESIYVGKIPSSTNNANYNIGIGYGNKGALNSITSGDKNIAIGFDSGRDTTTGNHNLSVGFYALYKNTEGLGNLGLGSYSSYRNTTGDYNIGMGYEAGFGNKTGDHNISIGYQTLYTEGYSPNKPSHNIALGYRAGYNITSADNNILIGKNAGNKSGSQLTTGDNNIGIGENVAFSSGTTDNEIVIGNTDHVNAKIYALRTPITNITDNTNLSANDSGQTFVFNDADGAIITLPDSGAGDLVGVYYHFIIGVTATSGPHKVVFSDTTNEKFYGQLNSIDTSSNMVTYTAQAGDNFSVVNSNGTTTGIIGSKYTITNFGADKWHIEGNIHHTDNTATPFATS